MSRKKALHSEANEQTATAQSSTDNNTRPRRERVRLSSSVLEELWSIWRADPRVPTIKSRRSWAVSRSANPRLVDSWFSRRRTCAKKAGTPISDDSYDLPLDPPIQPKREQSATPIKFEPDPTPDLSSDDTLVYPPDIDYLNQVEASSDTAFDGDILVERPQTPAYKEVPERFLSEPEPSSADPCAEKGFDTSFENASFPICNQGRGKRSNFTCILCSSESAQGATEFDSNTISAPRGHLVPCSRLDFLPTTLSELSAIPFLFCTPSAVLPDNTVSHQLEGVDDWAAVEDELGRLVNSGELDFSFLDVPLASMELID